MPDRPHVLILMPDQYRADCLGCAGHPIVRTPNLDRIAAEGVRFDNAYTPSPVCQPARSSFLSGLYCHNHGQWGNHGWLPRDTDTLARRLREGYHTCHVGKSHYYPHVKGDHLARHADYFDALGFDEVFEVTGPLATRTTDSIMTDRWRQLGCLETFRDDYRRRAEAGELNATWPSPMPPGETLDDFVGRTAVECVRGYDREQPLMLFVGFGGPHSPWDPPADWAAQYDPAEMDAPLPASQPSEWVPAAAAAYQRRVEGHLGEIDPQTNGRIRALYYAKISHIDSWVGAIVDAMKDRGMWDETAVVFWSNHGEMLCDKGRLSKSVFYESSARVPLVIRTPERRSAGAVSPALVNLVDLFPTICDLAGVDSGNAGHGRSLTPLLDEPGGRVHDAVFSEIGDRTMARTETHKFVTNAAGEPLLLYDLAADQTEEVNLLGRDDCRDVQAEMRDRLLRWHLATPSRQKRG